MTDTPSELATLAGPTEFGPLGPARPRAGIDLTRGPTRLGRYVLLSKLGEGGMGVVYAAFDETLDRKVAIKLLHAWTDAQAQQRLLREAQALARLSHPNVVQIYEIVELADAAFIVMEFVDGLTLRRWLGEGDARRSTRAIVEVFVAAGRGLAAAHAKGLVHRDFKPDNVMVDGEGRARVMDFGLAHGKLAEPAVAPARADMPAPDRLLESTSSLASDLTLTGSTMGTPAYMAPEQHRGLDTDARTDQFSFCISLWEALYRERPFAGGNLAALALAVSEGRPREPPRGADVPTWLRRVIERGLTVDPDRRWPSMEALHAALERDPTRQRRIALALVVALVLIVAAVVATRTASEREREHTLAACQVRGEAITEDWNPEVRDRLEQAFMATELGFAADAWQRTHTRLDDYAGTWSELRTTNCIATEVDQSRDPTTREWVDECLDERRSGFAALIEQLEQADAELLTAAITSAAKLPDLASCTDERWLAQRLRPPSDAGTGDRVADLRSRLERVRALEITGRYAEGASAARTLLVEAETLGWPPVEAEVRLALGRLLSYLEDNESSRVELERAFYLAGETGHDLVALRSAIDLVSVTSGEPAITWGRLGEMLVIRMAAEGSIDEAALLITIGNSLHERGDYAGALANQQQALTIFESRLGADHPLVSVALNNIGNAQSSLGDYAGAIATHRRSVALAESGLGPTHPGVATALMNLGITESARGDPDAALANYQRALVIAEPALGRDHPQVARMLNNIGNALVADGRPTEALTSFERAHAIWAEAFGNDNFHVGVALNNIGNAQYARGEYQQAIDSQDRSLALIERELGPDHPGVAHPLTSRAGVYRELGQLDAALDDDQRALTILVTVLGDQNPEVARALRGLGLDLAGQRRFELAIDALRRALAIHRLWVTGDEEAVERTEWKLREVMLEAEGAAR